MALIDKKSNAAIENLTDYEFVGIENLGLKNENDPYAYKIQKLGKKYLLLQKVALSKPEGFPTREDPSSWKMLHIPFLAAPFSSLPVPFPYQ